MEKLELPKFMENIHGVCPECAKNILITAKVCKKCTLRLKFDETYVVVADAELYVNEMTKLLTYELKFGFKQDSIIVREKSIPLDDQRVMRKFKDKLKNTWHRSLMQILYELDSSGELNNPNLPDVLKIEANKPKVRRNLRNYKFNQRIKFIHSYIIDFHYWTKSKDGQGTLLAITFALWIFLFLGLTHRI